MEDTTSLSNKADKHSIPKKNWEIKIPTVCSKQNDGFNDFYVVKLAGYWGILVVNDDKNMFFNILQQEQNNAIKVFLTTSNFFILVESTEKI